MGKLIFDIETVGDDFDNLDETTRDVLTKWIKRETDAAHYPAALDELKNGLGFSPLTGQIAAIGVLDSASGEGAVYFQSPRREFAEIKKDGIRLKAMDEDAMLKKFWQLADHYEDFVSFNGRGFDVPFLMVRSAIHQIRPSKDLMSNRYLSSQRGGARHIDLLDQLTFYGAVRRKGNLHLWCRAFGIKSPKAEGVTGNDVSRLFRDQQYQKIAEYNSGDLQATRKLLEYWEKYLSF